MPGPSRSVKAAPSAAANRGRPQVGPPACCVRGSLCARRLWQKFAAAAAAPVRHGTARRVSCAQERGGNRALWSRYPTEGGVPKEAICAPPPRETRLLPLPLSAGRTEDPLASLAGTGVAPQRGGRWACLHRSRAAARPLQENRLAALEGTRIA